MSTVIGIAWYKQEVLRKLRIFWHDLQLSKTDDDPEIKTWLALGIKTKNISSGKKKTGKKGDKAEELADT